MSRFTALFDACVLFPAQIRDLLIRLAQTECFRAKWTDEIHDEWIRSVCERRPDLDEAKLQRTRSLMDRAIRDCLVTGYDELIPALSLPDDDDRHVLAAAIRSGADVIVTYNLKDFPQHVLDRYGIDAQHPDEFVSHLLDLVPSDVCSAVKAMRAALKKPPLTVDELLASLERCGLAQTVAILRAYEDVL